MTMPKFEPVAEVLWYDPELRMTPEPAGKIIDSSMSFIESAAIGTQLYTADQLTEAYEAGKREQAAELETAKADIATARRTAEYWKANHLAGNEQLAAEQAKNMGLREALEYSIKQVPELATVPGISKALSTPSDTSALEAYVTKAGEKMREYAQTACVDKSANGNFICDTREECFDAICAIPAVKLEDLK